MSLTIFRSFITATLLSAGIMTPALSADEDIEVVFNQAKIVKLSRAADTVVVGNPEIADALVKDSTTIVITGKYFGSTNFVVLDANGAVIVDRQIRVSRSTDDTVNVYRQSSSTSFTCTPFCEALHQGTAASGGSSARAAN
jgi:Flp pilus assembly secretin CpaC